MTDQHTYFKETPAPPNLIIISKSVSDFVAINQAKGKKVVLISSGGTTVSLEQNTVRFLDNFSAGTRGATSAEYFIAAGYSVIFLHRQFSLEPYSRHYSHSKNCFLDLLETKGDDVCIKNDHLAEIKKIMLKYQKATSESLLLKLSFTTVSEYLFLLRSIALLLVPLGRKAMFYLAAAVSDFYIPQNQMSEHKIQSGDGKLHLDLEQVPKILKPLVEEWALNAFTVSFKLETDPSILISKSRAALDRYGHSVVVANNLHTRKYVVWLVTKECETEIRLSSDQQVDGVEIEKTKRTAAVRAASKLGTLNNIEREKDIVLCPSSGSEFEADDAISDADENETSWTAEVDLVKSYESVEEEEELLIFPVENEVVAIPSTIEDAVKHEYAASSDDSEDEKILDDGEPAVADDSPPDFTNPQYLEFIEMLKEALGIEFKSLTVVKEKDEKEEIVTFFKSNAARIPCPIAACEKSFLNFEGIKYHMLNFIHDLKSLCGGSHSSNKEYFDLLQKLKEKSLLVPANLFPVDIPWIFSKKDRIKSILLKVRLSIVPPLEKKGKGKLHTAPKKIIPKSLEGLEDIFDPRLTQSTATLNVHISTNNDEESYTTAADEFLTVSRNDAYPDDFFQKDILFMFSKKSTLTSVPIMECILRDTKKFKIFINSGLSVWALDWVPCNNEDVQYLAVGGYMSYSEHHEFDNNQDTNMQNVLQIWRIVHGQPAIHSLSIAHEFGRVLHLKWCPNNSYSREKGRLGYLAGIFGDGSCRVTSVPFPSDEAPTFLKWKCSLFEVSSDEYSFTSINWSSKNWLIAGCSNGAVSVWNLKDVLSKGTDSKSISRNPILYTNLHGQYVTTVSFLEISGNSFIVSCAADGQALFTDVRDPDVPIKLVKVLAIIAASCAVKLIDCVIIAEDLRIRGYQIDADGTGESASFVLSQHKSTIWDMDHSLYFPFLASVSSDGCLNVTNSARSFKRRIGGALIYSLFQVTIHEPSKALCFDEKIQEKKIEESKFSIWDERVAIHKVKWNPNRKFRDLIATSGMGWIRIESAYM